MGLQGNTKIVVYEILGAFVLILLLVVFRPLFVGQVAQAGQPYTVQVNATGTQTVTPSATLSTSQVDTIYSIVIFIVALVALIVILLTVAGKI